jgi:hypothetical protein
MCVRLQNTRGNNPNPLKMAPFQVGDFITYAGVLTNTDNLISVYEIINNVAIYTLPGVDPAYSVFEVAIIGTGGLNVLGAGAYTHAFTTLVYSGMRHTCIDAVNTPQHLTAMLAAHQEHTNDNRSVNSSTVLTLLLLLPSLLLLLQPHLQAKLQSALCTRASQLMPLGLCRSGPWTSTRLMAHLHAVILVRCFQTLDRWEPLAQSKAVGGSVHSALLMEVSFFVLFFVFFYFLLSCIVYVCSYS